MKTLSPLAARHSRALLAGTLLLSALAVPGCKQAKDPEPTGLLTGKNWYMVSWNLRQRHYPSGANPDTIPFDFSSDANQHCGRGLAYDTYFEDGTMKHNQGLVQQCFRQHTNGGWELLNNNTILRRTFWNDYPKMLIINELTPRRLRFTDSLHIIQGTYTHDLIYKFQYEAR
ncbi:hypothetical protein GCM10023185_42980 [Hymenobacter saemangeumensis]|uniref:Lipocalin-like domain-containing protein n=1 Tax=Hymenobacter saemangeumensis TaxID=1084522 RepID=A0ABP8IRU7_9BACT